MIHGTDHAHIYGPSTANQRIEALWSKLAPAMMHWREFFANLIHDGQYTQTTVQVAAMRYCFMELVQKSLDDFKGYWNTHHIRQSSECPGGVPDVLYYTDNGEDYGAIPTANQRRQMSDVVTEPVGFTGDSDIEEYLDYVSQELHFQRPRNKQEALAHYTAFIDAAE